jgi:altronate hydrolase
VVRALRRTECSRSAPTVRRGRKHADDTNLNSGGIVDGADSVDACGGRIFRLILGTASGRKTKSELHGYGQNEFVPWQLGAVM